MISNQILVFPLVFLKTKLNKRKINKSYDLGGGLVSWSQDEKCKLNTKYWHLKNEKERFSIILPAKNISKTIFSIKMHFLSIFL